MKTNYWMILGTMIAAGAVAQVNTNTLPEVPAPASSSTPAMTEPAASSETTPEAAPAKAKPAPKKHVVQKINEPAVTLYPGPATVIPSNLNIRGQAGLKGEVVGHLKKGDSVTVLSQINLDKHAPNEPAQWAEILLPSDIKVWVFSHYIDPSTKTVTANRLNMRGGPGENFSVLGTLEKGQTVTEISTKGKWIQIQPPGTAFGFVAAMYLEQAPAAVASAAPQAQSTETVPQAAAMTSAQTAPAMAMATTSSTTGTTSSQGAPVASATETAPFTPQSGQPIEPVIETAPPTNFPPRVVSHEGRVRGSVSPVAPTAYELYDPTTRNTINYLYTGSTNLDLSRYSGAQIIVTGEEGLAPRWKDTPVLTIQRIYVVDAHPPVAYENAESPRASRKNISGTQHMQRR